MVRRTVPGGEIFPVLFTNPQDLMSTVRGVPALIIERIEWCEGDYEAELAYKEVGLVGRSRNVGGCRRGHGSACDPSTPVMLHYAVNCPVGALRGESDLAPILPWLKRYSRWLEDRAPPQRRRVRLPPGSSRPRRACGWSWPNATASRLNQAR